jgi:hypothetical protein
MTFSIIFLLVIVAYQMAKIVLLKNKVSVLNVIIETILSDKFTHLIKQFEEEAE